MRFVDLTAKIIFKIKVKKSFLFSSHMNHVHSWLMWWTAFVVTTKLKHLFELEEHLRRTDFIDPQKVTKIALAQLRIQRLTWEIVKRCRDVFRWISIGCVADYQAGFPHSSVPEKHALQQPPLAVRGPGGSGFVWGHRRRHQVTVIHVRSDALLDRTAGGSHTPNGVTREKHINKGTLSTTGRYEHCVNALDPLLRTETVGFINPNYSVSPRKITDVSHTSPAE